MNSEYRIKGLIIGIIIGCMVGACSAHIASKRLRTVALPVGIIIGVIVFGSSGYSLGKKADRDVYIEKVLGIINLREEIVKQGRFWYAITKWNDERDVKENILITGKSTSGILVSSLNEITILNHVISSGSQVNVIRYHKIAKKYIFQKLKATFNDENSQYLPSIFPAI